MIHITVFEWSRDISGVQAKLNHFEDKLPQLKQVTTILEIALWNMKMNEKIKKTECVFSSSVACQRVEALVFIVIVWHDHITNVIQTAVFKWNGDNLVILHEIPPQIEGGYDNIRDCTVEDEVERGDEPPRYGNLKPEEN